MYQSFTRAGKKINTYIASDWTNTTYFPGPISSYTCIGSAALILSYTTFYPSKYWDTQKEAVYCQFIVIKISMLIIH